jgi:hypothetical protein
MSERLYLVVAINEAHKTKTYLTTIPIRHQVATTLLRKLTSRPYHHIRHQLEEWLGEYTRAYVKRTDTMVRVPRSVLETAHLRMNTKDTVMVDVLDDNGEVVGPAEVQESKLRFLIDFMDIVDL